MSVHVLEREQRIEAPLERAFGFFSDASNLEAITPPWLGFRIVTPGPIVMSAGTLIEYRLRLHGIPVRWRTRIETWKPPLGFEDVQLEGPYGLWHHSHSFQADGNATIMRDRVRYSLPLGPVGELAHRMFVRRDLDRIFDFRTDEVARRLNGGEP